MGLSSCTLASPRTIGDRIDIMLMHNVYFWLPDDISDDDRKAFGEEGLASLVTIEGTVSSGYGIPAATPKRPVVDDTYDYWLTLTFNTIEEQNTYQTHPTHDAFIERFSPFFKEVKVYDGTLVGPQPATRLRHGECRRGPKARRDRQGSPSTFSDGSRSPGRYKGLGHQFILRREKRL